MKRIEQIMKNPLFVENQDRIDELEKTRVYCCHGLNHSLDVARILYIKVLEQGIEISKDVIYGAALLHDIGRGLEYEKGTGHHKEGARIAQIILQECGYSVTECEQIVKAIAAHKKNESEDILCKLLYESDKLSRNCFDCQAAGDCYWPEDKKNKGIEY